MKDKSMPPVEEVQKFCDKNTPGRNFHTFLEAIDKQLAKNIGKGCSPNFLHGNSMTIADTSYGQFFMRFVNSDFHRDQKIYQAEVAKYPRVQQWCNNTIKATFADWHSKQPRGLMNG